MNDILPTLPAQRPQQQTSLDNQIEQVKAWFRREWPVSEPITNVNANWYAVANRLGCYDAADFIRTRKGPIDWCRLDRSTKPNPTAEQMYAGLVEIWYASEMSPCVKAMVEALIGKPDESHS